MFKNEFQGGLSLEILSIQGKDFNSKCKILGTSINGGHREFDKSIKSNVLILEGESTRTKLIIPKDEKQTLCILQPYLIIQLFVAGGVSFSLEAIVLDSANQKRRILMSTSYKDISVTAFHVKVPLTTVKRDTWLNLCLDLSSFIMICFKGNTFKALENIVVCANCRLRRIFTMRIQPKDSISQNIDANGNVCEEIPKALQFGNFLDTQYYTQVLNIENLQSANIKLRVSSGMTSSSAIADQQKPEKSKKTHIAFGSRVAVPKHASRSGSRGSSSNGFERQSSVVSLNSSNGLNNSTSQFDNNSNSSVMPQIEGQKPLLQPRPPKPNSGKSIRRPNPRIRSAESARLVKRAKLKSESNENEELSDSGIESKSCMTDVVNSNGNEGTGGKLTKTERYTSKLRDMDENNNAVGLEHSQSIKTEAVVGHVSEKLVGMKMGNQEDEENYFRTRNDSESHSETSRSKDGSFSSTVDSENFFLYASRPRSILVSTSKGKKNLENAQLNITQPKVVIDKASQENDESTTTHILASFESDFQRESSDSESEDPIAKMHKVNNGNRSPRDSLLGNLEDSARIRSSLLKEISPPSQPRYDHVKYQSFQSDSMSWMYDSDSSQVLSRGHSSQSQNRRYSPIKHDIDKSPRISQLKVLGGLSEGDEVGSDSEDILSDASDETSYSTWKEPPTQIRNYRYQDEMQGVGMTLDLSATLPLTPFIESPTKPETTTHTSDSGISMQGSNAEHSKKPLDVETELDLLYDPVLNCYFDPNTHKYYELA